MSFPPPKFLKSTYSNGNRLRHDSYWKFLRISIIREEIRVVLSISQQWSRWLSALSPMAGRDWQCLWSRGLLRCTCKWMASQSFWPKNYSSCLTRCSFCIHLHHVLCAQCRGINEWRGTVWVALGRLRIVRTSICVRSPSTFSAGLSHFLYQHVRFFAASNFSTNGIKVLYHWPIDRGWRARRPRQPPNTMELPYSLRPPSESPTLHYF